MNHDQHVKRKQYEDMFMPFELTDEDQRNAERQIKQDKINRRIGIPREQEKPEKWGG